MHAKELKALGLYGEDIMNDPAGKLVKITSAQVFPVCRALLVGTAGTATIIDAEGATATDVPLQQGYNPLRATRVTFGTANNVWALY